MGKAIEVKNLIKDYDEVRAVNQVSFDVEENSFFAFLGPNGAGKSTTINIISTLLEKTEGRVLVFGKEVGKDDFWIRSQIGVVFQTSMLDDLLTVEENLSIRSAFYQMDKSAFTDRIAQICKYMDIMPFYKQRYGTLSGGQKRKADIARALIHWPKILILDEPTAGLDPKSRREIWKLIEDLRKEHAITIFLTTHYMEEVLDANRIVVIDEGDIKAIGSSEELRMKYSSDRVKIIPKQGLKERLIQDKIAFFEVNGTVNVEVEDSFSGIPFVQKYQEYIQEFEILRGDMDDVFLNITGRKLVTEE